MAKFMTESDFAQAIRDGESLGIPKATTYQNLKMKGYQIEGEPEDSPSPQKSGGVFGYFSDVIKNSLKEAGSVVKFGVDVVADPTKGLEFARDTMKGAGILAVGGAENLYEKATGNRVPNFNPDGTVTYPSKSIYEDQFAGGTKEQQAAAAFGRELVGAVTHLPTTFREHPLSTLSAVAPLASGVLGRVSTIGKVGETAEVGRGMAGLAETAGYSRTANALSTAGKVSAALDPVQASLTAVTKVPSATVRYGRGALGAMTGAGDEAVRIAAQAKEANGAFYQGMRGDVLEQARILADDSRKAVSALKADRSRQYLKTKEAIQSITAPLSAEPIQTTLAKTMKEFGISQKEKDILDSMIGMSDEQASLALNNMLKTGDGTLSPLVKAGIGEGPTASKISKAINYVENWDDFTPQSLDNLQQALTTIGAKPGTREYVFIDKLKKGVQGVVKEKYPEYTKLLSDYTDASTFIDEIEGAIGAGNRADVEKVVLKMSQTMKTGNLRFEIKNALVKQLEELTGLPLRERIAGMALAEYYPRGLAKVGAGVGTAGAIGIGGIGVLSAPSFWMAVGLSSPRVVGEVLGAIGVAKSYIPTVVDSLKNIMPFGTVLKSENAVRTSLPTKGIMKAIDELPATKLTPEAVQSTISSHADDALSAAQKLSKEGTISESAVPPQSPSAGAPASQGTPVPVLQEAPAVDGAVKGLDTQGETATEKAGAKVRGKGDKGTPVSKDLKKQFPNLAEEEAIAKTPAIEILGRDAPIFNFKTKSAKTLESEQGKYMDFMRGKKYKGYGGVDEILDVKKQSNGQFLYTVRDTSTGEIRTHGTVIRPYQVIKEPINSNQSTKSPVSR